VHDTKKRLLSWTELHENPVMLGKNDPRPSSLMSSRQAMFIEELLLQFNAIPRLPISTDSRP
jgi:hypothetical protein